MKQTVHEMEAASALHHHNSKWLPYKYDINVYRGCSHRCVYCYALYTHEYIGGSDFYGEVFAKTNIAEVLKRELAAHGREVVNLGGVCDSYQHAERELKLMPQVLSVLAQYRVPTVVCTKSTLILRDIERLKRVDDAGALGTALTVTTMDETVAALIEPGAPSPRMRMDTVAQLKANGIRCGVHMMPVIPYLTGGARSLEAVYAAAKRAGADYVLAGILNLKGHTRKAFFDSVHRAFPEEARRLRALYADKETYYAYKERLAKELKRLRVRYDMPAYRELDVPRDTEQLSFL